MQTSRLDRTQSLLLVIDVQSRLVPAIHDGDCIVASCEWLVRVAEEMAVPVLMTEQSPDAIGPTVDSLGRRVSDDERFSKTHFSCAAEPGFIERLNQAGKTQILVCGMEAHVCVMQTVLDLISRDFDVFIVEDALGSRFPTDLACATTRMTAAGATAVTREMVFFELLQVADREKFSPLLRKFITGDGGLDQIRQSQI